MLTGTGSPADVRQPPLEQAPLGVVVHQSEGSPIRLAGLVHSTQAPQQLTAHRMQVAVVLQREAVDDLETRRGTVRLRDRDRSVELDDGRVGQARELTIEGGD